MAIEAVFWDMDGTLLDNEVLYDVAITKTLKAYNLTLLGDFPAGTCFEEQWKLMMKQANPPQVSYSQWMDEMHHHCSIHLQEEHIRPGVVEALQTIFDAGLPQTCVSNAESHIIQKYFARTGLTPFFSSVVGRDHVPTGKPTPAPYLRACELNGKSPQHCVAVEDSEVGVRSAKEAGLNVVAYPNRYTENNNFSKADYMIGHPRELLEIMGLTTA